MHVKPILIFVLAAFIIISFAPAAFGQAESGTITGTVHDPSGAVVAGAKRSGDKRSKTRGDQNTG